jgi:hypothetical protein
MEIEDVLSPVRPPLEQLGLAVRPIEQQDELVQTAPLATSRADIVADHNHTWEKHRATVKVCPLVTSWRQPCAGQRDSRGLPPESRG